jgi:hypothetical protein
MNCSNTPCDCDKCSNVVVHDKKKALTNSEKCKRYKDKKAILKKAAEDKKKHKR